MALRNRNQKRARAAIILGQIRFEVSWNDYPTVAQAFLRTARLISVEDLNGIKGDYTTYYACWFFSANRQSMGTALNFDTGFGLILYRTFLVDAIFTSLINLYT